MLHPGEANMAEIHFQIMLEPGSSRATVVVSENPVPAQAAFPMCIYGVLWFNLCVERKTESSQEGH